MRLRSAMSASTRSPARTFVDGFAGDPFTRTWPASHKLVASGRVLTRRTAHSQRSIRVSAGARGPVTRSSMARLEEVPRWWATAIQERDYDAPDRRRADVYSSARIGAAAALTIVLFDLLVLDRSIP